MNVTGELVELFQVFVDGMVSAGNADARREIRAMFDAVLKRFEED